MPFDYAQGDISLRFIPELNDIVHSPMLNKPDCMDAVNDALNLEVNFTAGRKAGLF